jgi:hypothetical protein
MTSLASLPPPHFLPLGSHSDPLSLLPPCAFPIVTMLMAKLLLLRVWHKLGLLLGGPFFVPKKNNLPRSRKFRGGRGGGWRGGVGGGECLCVHGRV